MKSVQSILAANLRPYESVYGVEGRIQKRKGLNKNQPDLQSAKLKNYDFSVKMGSSSPHDEPEPSSST